MGQAAVFKLDSDRPMAISVSWDGDHTYEATEKRNTIVSFTALKGRTVDELLTSDVWDDPPPAKLIERIKWW